jgi:nucleoside-diphosphate kinase
MAKLEKTLVIIKPDAVSRSLVGEIIHRFERKGLEVVGLKMAHLQDKELEEHYIHLKDKPFFKDLVDFMKHSPSILMVIEGVRAVEAVRFLAGSTYGLEADPGTIRGDFSMSTSNNVVHASDSVENAKKEIDRFFKKDEIFSYKRVDWQEVYNLEEQKV